MNILPVSYVPQLGIEADEHNNDCGASSSLMLLRSYSLAKEVTVDQIYNLIKPSGDSALSAGELQVRMASYGLKTEWKVDMTVDMVYTYLRNKRPILALIHYAALVDAKLTERTGFRGAHFIVITGIDLDSVFINDPYRTDNQTNIAIPIAIFEKAWKDCVFDGNPVGGCIIPKLPIQDLSIPVPPVSDLYSLLVNGLNVRSGPASTYPFVRTIWKATEPTVRAVKISGEYIQLTDLSGWVYFMYLKKI